MVIGILVKFTEFLKARGAVSLPDEDPIGPMQICGPNVQFRLDDGRTVQIFEARLGNSPVYRDRCNRYEVREVAA
jgi:hypothetical protein